MNGMLVFVVCVLAIMMLLGGNTASILGLFIMVLVLATALRMMFWRRHRGWGSHLVGNLALLILGPIILVWLFSPLISSIRNGIIGVQLPSRWLWLLAVVFILAVFSWYRLQRWQHRQRGVDRFALRGSEREYVFPHTEYPRRREPIERDDEVWDQ